MGFYIALGLHQVWREGSLMKLFLCLIRLISTKGTQSSHDHGLLVLSETLGYVLHPVALNTNSSGFHWPRTATQYTVLCFWCTSRHCYHHVSISPQVVVSVPQFSFSFSSFHQFLCTLTLIVVANVVMRLRIHPACGNVISVFRGVGGGGCKKKPRLNEWMKITSSPKRHCALLLDQGR